MGSNPAITPIQRFWRLLKPDYKEVRNVYIYAIFHGLIYLSLPLGIQGIVNLIQSGRVSTSLVLLIIFVVAGVGITGVLQIYQMRITENLQQKIFTRAAFEFAYRLPRIRLETLYRQYAPELMNRFFDVMTVQKSLSKILIDFSVASLQIIFGLILLSFYHPFFILFSFVLVVLICTIFYIRMKKGLQTSLDESKHKYKAVYWLEEVARTATSFKMAGKSNLPLNKTNIHTSNYLTARESHFRILVQQYSMMVLFKVLVATGLLAIGTLLVMEQLMNIGQFVAAEIIILMIMNSVEKLIQTLHSIYDILTGLEKLGQVSDLELDRNEGVDMPLKDSDGGLKIEMENVSFRYPGKELKVLHNISLSVKQGESVLLKGHNGAGKSTLLQLIAGLYDVQEGQIFYNEVLRENLNMSSLRSLCGECLSHEEIFHGTVQENISMDRSDVSTADVEWAVESVGLQKFLKHLPQGYNSVLSPMGRNISRSIIHKILLARSIVHKPRLLLLENVFEQLNKGEAESIMDFLTSKSNPWTFITNTENPYMEQLCDRVIHLRDGRIVKDEAKGSAKNTTYRK